VRQALRDVRRDALRQAETPVRGDVAMSKDFNSELEADLARGKSGGQGRLTDAKWGDPAALIGTSPWTYRDAQGRVIGVLLGYADGRVIGYADDRHIVTVAGSRAGKSVSLLVPALLTYNGSVVVIDPKGDLARTTGRARAAMGQKIIRLDPFGAIAPETSSFNPLAELDPESPHVVEDAGQIADAMIIQSEREPHFTQNGRALVKVLILFVLTLPEPERHLMTVWKLLTMTHESVRSLQERAECGPRTALLKLLAAEAAAFDGAIAAGANRFLEMADRELAGVFSTATAQLDFLDGRAMGPALQRNDVKLSELKTGKVTIYLCLPATRMGTHSRWLRVIINMALVAIERERTQADIPVLMVLDEFAVLGNMPSVEKAAGLMAGFGVKLWTVLQDITQLQREYRQSWQTFVGNAGLITLWGNTDKATLDYFSEMLGQTSVRLEQPSGATATQRLGGARAVREELRVQRLAAPNELEQLLARQKGRLLVKAPGYDPIIVKRITYYADKPFAGLFDA
jgi:type IV secretion system protein VirD4